MTRQAPALTSCQPISMRLVGTEATATTEQQSRARRVHTTTRATLSTSLKKMGRSIIQHVRGSARCLVGTRLCSYRRSSSRAVLSSRLRGQERSPPTRLTSHDPVHCERAATACSEWWTTTERKVRRGRSSLCIQGTLIHLARGRSNIT